MSEKDPLLTRSKIREMKKQESKFNKLKERELQKEFDEKEKKISQFFSKEHKKLKPVKGSRAQQTEKLDGRNQFLNQAIIIVVLLLIILFLAIKYL